MNDTLEIVTLGGLDIRLGAQPVRDRLSRKAGALLCYLALEGRARTREHLAGLLWGESTDAHAHGSLRKALSELRASYPSHVVITRNSVAFKSDAPHRLDVAAFQEQVSWGLRQDTGSLTEEQVAALTEAVTQYRGDFLEGLFVRGALAFEEWVLIERERFRQCVLRALHALAAHHAACGAKEQAIACTRRLLELEPAQEEAHRNMMSLLALTGQQVAALRQYELCRQVLADELAIAPDAATTALYERIRAGQAADPTSQRTLPAPLTPLIGREDELTAIRRRLADPACRLLSLVGPGGVGKTHLALTAAADLRGDEPFADGVVFVPLGPIDAAAGCLSAIAHALGFLFYQQAEPRRQLLGYLRDRRLLLVLDSCEHLLFTPSIRPNGGKEEEGTEELKELVTQILQTAPSVKVLITSRVRLNVGFEHVLALGGLDYPRERALEDTAAFSGVRLFLAGAGRARPDLEFEARDLGAVARICQAVGGLPLAILLAAGRARTLTPVEIAARLEDHRAEAGSHTLDFLTTDWADLPARQRGMRAVFEDSWNLLTQHERDIFPALSVFRGGFTAQAAEQVARASALDLAALVDKSLLQCNVAGHYALHDLMRQYAAQKLAEAPGGAKAVQDRHCAYYAVRLKGWGRAIHGPHQEAALDELASESENACAAWNWAAERGLAARLDEAMDSLCYFCKWRGRYREGERACQRAIDGLSASVATREVAESLRVLARAVAWQGVFHWRLGHTQQARAQLSYSQELLEDPALAGKDTRRERAFAWWRTGRMLFDIDRDRAQPLYERSLALYRSLGDRWATANVLDDLSWVARYLSDYGTERELAEESLALRRSLGDARGISRALRALSSVAYLQGRLAKAEQLIRRSAAIPLQGGSRGEIADRLSGKGWILGMLGKFEEGERLLGESVALWEELGVSKMAAIIGIPLGFMRMHQGRYVEARALLRTGLRVAREIGDRGCTAFGLFLLSWVALAEGAYAEADELLQESAVLFRELSQRDEVGQARALSGYAALGRQQRDQAQRCLHEALQIGDELKAFLPVLFALPAVAWLAADQDQPERAVELYALASRYPFVANSHWFDQVAAPHIAVPAAELPPHVATAARERGRASDREAAVAELLTELECRICRPSPA
jgi:DNA-binding SARP family transcriptional activator/predicted ATPase